MAAKSRQVIPLTRAVSSGPLFPSARRSRWWPPASAVSPVVVMSRDALRWLCELLPEASDQRSRSNRTAAATVTMASTVAVSVISRRLECRRAQWPAPGSRASGRWSRLGSRRTNPPAFSFCIVTRPPPDCIAENRPLRDRRRLRQGTSGFTGGSRFVRRQWNLVNGGGARSGRTVPRHGMMLQDAW